LVKIPFFIESFAERLGYVAFAQNFSLKQICANPNHHKVIKAETIYLIP